MRFLKTILIGIIGLGILVGIVGLFIPNVVRVEREILINASPERVFSQVNSLEQFNQWSPWADLDPDTQYTYSDPGAGVGAVMTWDSDNGNVGTGRMEIQESRDNEWVKSRLEFGWGSPAEASFELSLVDGDTGGTGGTRVVWGFYTYLESTIEKYFGLKLDNWIEQAYDKGLQRLKTRVEAE